MIVHAWEEWGEDCFSRFNGQWALALWDGREQRLVLSRDRLGVRPLFYSRTTGRAAVRLRGEGALRGSRRWRVPSILPAWTRRSPTGRPSLRAPCSAAWSSSSPGMSLSLTGAASARPRTGASRFPNGDGSRCRTPRRTPQALRERIIEAARLRFLRSDVPVGAYLSGGLDSSITAAVISRYTNAPLHTFSLRFSDREFDEGHYQKKMSVMLGTRASGHRGEPAGHRRDLPPGDLAHGDTCPPRGARAAVPAVEAGARERVQGRRDRRGCRRGPRRVRHLP